MFRDGGGEGLDAAEDFLGNGLVGDLEPVMFIERDHQLEGINRVEAEPAGAEKRLLIADLRGGHLEHEVLHHHAFDVLFKRR